MIMLKKEEQQLHLEYEYPKKTSLKYPKDKLYFEKTVTIQPDFKLDKNESYNEQFEQIMSHFKEIKPGIDKIVSDNKKKYPTITRDYIQAGWKLKV